MLSRELTSPVFIDIAFGAGHTYSHWRRAPPRNTCSAGRGPTSENPMLQGENFFLMSFFFEINRKKLQKTDCSGVLAEVSPDFLSMQPLIASF